MYTYNEMLFGNVILLTHFIKALQMYPSKPLFLKVLFY